MRVIRPAGSVLFNFAVFQAVLQTAEQVYSRGRAVMSLPEYINIVEQPVVVLGIALMGLVLLHKAAIDVDVQYGGGKTLLDVHGQPLSARVGAIGVIHKRDFVIVAITVVAAVAVYGGWVHFSEKMPEKQVFDEWAIDFHRVVRGGVKKPVVAAESNELRIVNDEMQPVYSRIIGTLREGLVSYRIASPNMYVWLPPIPPNILSGDSATYRGAVIISADCAWSIRVDGPDAGGGRRGPRLILEQMDGDGSTKSGRSIGSLAFMYNIDSKQIELSITGGLNPVLSAIPRRARVNEVEFAVGRAFKLLVEQQLMKCGVSAAGDGSGV